MSPGRPEPTRTCPRQRRPHHPEPEQATMVYTPLEIAKAAADVYDVSRTAVLRATERQPKNITDARRLAAAYLTEKGVSLTEIARVMGGGSHRNAIYWVSTFDRTRPELFEALLSRAARDSPKTAPAGTITTP